MCIVNKNKLKILRDELKLSQKKFAQQLKISYSEYQKLENGIIENPGINMIYNIAKQCYVSMDWLCDLTEIRYCNDPLHPINELKDKPDILKKILNIFKNKDHLAILMIVLDLLENNYKLAAVKKLIEIK